MALASGRYRGCNQHHFTELLAEREGLVLSRSSVRRILVAAGLKSPRRRRPPQHRSRRERYPQEGMLLQIDGSRHDWLEGRGPYLTLVGAVDDATGTVPYALFREQEDTRGYFLLLGEIIRRQGIPGALYSDRHSIFVVSPKGAPSLEEQLAGARQPTQFGRALKELGINPIFALSPQAKGRIERLWGTFQDRLVSELRLAQASTLEEATAVLGAFLPRFNARFGVAAAQAGCAYLAPDAQLCLDSVLCYKHYRTVAKDNTVRLGPRTLQVLPGPKRLSYAQARVEVQERLDGQLMVSYQGQPLVTREPPRLQDRRAVEVSPAGAQGVDGGRWAPRRAGACRQAGHQRLPAKPGPDHPWRRSMVTKSLNH